MSDATQTTPPPQRTTEPFHGWELPARAPDGCEEPDELNAVAVLSTN